MPIAAADWNAAGEYALLKPDTLKSQAKKIGRNRQLQKKRLKNWRKETLKPAICKKKHLKKQEINACQNRGCQKNCKTGKAESHYWQQELI